MHTPHTNVKGMETVKTKRDLLDAADSHNARDPKGIHSIENTFYREHILWRTHSIENTFDTYRHVTRTGCNDHGRLNPLSGLCPVRSTGDMNKSHEYIP